MTERGPPLVLGKQGHNAQTCHYLYVDNNGIVSAQSSQFYAAEKRRLMLHTIAVSSGSGPAPQMSLRWVEFQK